MIDHEFILWGCGNRRLRMLRPERLSDDPSYSYDQKDPLTWPFQPSEHWPKRPYAIDGSPECGADSVQGLDSTEDHIMDSNFRRIEGSTVKEIHAYEVLEHMGDQGDHILLFAQFSEFWRVLRPGGFLCATVPWWQSKWAWGDPGHRRVIQPETLGFLDQTSYANVGKGPLSDYRGVYGADFRCRFAFTDSETFAFILQAVKPARIVP